MRKKRYAKKKKPNIAFKRDTPCRGIIRLRVSSWTARCSGFMVGAPLNSNVRRPEKSGCFSDNATRYALIPSLAKEYVQRERAVVADRPDSAL